MGISIILFFPLAIMFYYQTRILANLFENNKPLKLLTLCYDKVHYYVLILTNNPKHRPGDVCLYDPQYGAEILEITDLFVDHGYLKYEWRSLTDPNWEYKYHQTSAIDVLTSPISRQSVWFLLYAGDFKEGTKSARG